MRFPAFRWGAAGANGGTLNNYRTSCTLPRRSGAAQVQKYDRTIWRYTLSLHPIPQTRLVVRTPASTKLRAVNGDSQLASDGQVTSSGRSILRRQVSTTYSIPTTFRHAGGTTHGDPRTHIAAT